MAESVTLAGIAGPPAEPELSLDPLEAAVVAAIRREGPLSRTDLAEHLGYSRASVTALAGRMLAAGILSEAGEGKSAGGRRPWLLDINPDLGYVAGVDIGATEYIHERLLAQRQQGTATLLISEDLDEILALSDRIAVLYEGRVMDIVPRAEATAERLGLLMAGVAA